VTATQNTFTFAGFLHCLFANTNLTAVWVNLSPLATPARVSEVYQVWGRPSSDGKH